MLKIFIFKEKGVVKSEKGDGVLLYNYKLTLSKKTFIMINTGIVYYTFLSNYSCVCLNINLAVLERGLKKFSYQMKA